MRGVVEWLLAQFPDLQMTIEAIVADGDTSLSGFSPRARIWESSTA